MFNKPAVNNIINEELSPFLNDIGYKCTRSKGGDFFYEKTDNINYYSFYCFAQKYSHEFKFIYGFELGINKVYEILNEINLQVPINSIKKSFTGISPGQLLDPLDIFRGYKYFHSKETLITILNEVKTFYWNQVIPFDLRNSNIFELDKHYNSLENFQKDSWGKFPSLNHFHITRLIIAKLANNPQFEIVVERNFQALEEIFIKDGGIFPRNDMTIPEVFASEYLKKLVI